MPSTPPSEVPNEKLPSSDTQLTPLTDPGKSGLTDLAVNQTVTLPSARVPAEPPKQKSNSRHKSPPAQEPRK